MCHVQKAVSIGIEWRSRLFAQGGGQLGRSSALRSAAMHSTLTS